MVSFTWLVHSDHLLVARHPDAQPFSRADLRKKSRSAGDLYVLSDRFQKLAMAAKGRGCVETHLHAGALATAENAGFTCNLILVEMCRVKEVVFALSCFKLQPHTS